MEYEKIIILTRTDVRPERIVSTSNLDWNDIKPEIMSQDIYNHAETILFLDGKEYKFIKNVYADKYADAQTTHAPAGQKEAWKWQCDAYNKMRNEAVEIGNKIHEQFEKAIKAKPFDLDAALEGKPIVTRNGSKVLKIALFQGTKPEPVIAAQIEGLDIPIIADAKTGRVAKCLIEHDFDLFMTPTTRTVWVNIYSDSSNSIAVTGNKLSGSFWNSEEFANKAADDSRIRLGGRAHPITIEE